jgi:hypothetical protein
MSKKMAAGGLALVIGMFLLSACGNVGSVSPAAPGGHAAHALCSDDPKQPGCN